MIKLSGLQGSTMSQLQKETEKLATDLNTNFKQVITNSSNVGIVELGSSGFEIQLSATYI